MKKLFIVVEHENGIKESVQIKFTMNGKKYQNIQIPNEGVITGLRKIELFSSLKGFFE